jgi:hypothetical protein
MLNMIHRQAIGLCDQQQHKVSRRLQEEVRQHGHPVQSGTEEIQRSQKNGTDGIQ